MESQQEALSGQHTQARSWVTIEGSVYNDRGNKLRRAALWDTAGPGPRFSKGGANGRSICS
ncbi:hypothetical protein CY34DRAFT_814009 [Suillus luteus UH-Slu-Lm8-n1]|uniref:Uncharacterized protein n=1 Tax=Suillus luteus UH-Slu-Lm8-n1 TaxID=930992 RepID=A0A0C9Z5Z0_9AGAM|nr:hypothetical protein CY34DRAFT_814009 [Suillus luteus UH-Slu-Lm8-n1]